jgi:hypothetical protein
MLTLRPAPVVSTFVAVCAGVSIAAALGCSSSPSTYQGGGRMLQPPGDNGLGLLPVDAGADNAMSDGTLLSEFDASSPE